MEFLRTVAEWIVLGLLSLGLITAPAALPQDQAVGAALPQQDALPQDQAVGAALPQQDALVDTYLSAGINKTVTEMTLADGTTRDGETLIGYYCFTIDINTPTVEYVCGTASSTSVTGLLRGVKASDPTATSSSLAFIHRKLASVQVTDFPFNQLVQRRINGTDAFESALTFNAVNTYASALTFTPGSNQIPSVLYVDSLANQGAATSSETIGGIVELATQIEMASSTDLGASRPLVLQAKYATSTCTVATLSAVITQNNGKIAQGCLDWTQSIAFSGNNTFSGTSAFSGATTFTATSTIATSTASINFKPQAYVIASTTITGGTSPQPIYLASTTGAALLSDGNAVDAEKFDGFAVSSATNGSQVLIQTGGIVSGFTGLTVGADYYVQDAVGTIGTTVGTAEVYVGTAVSTTQIVITKSRDWQYLGSQSLTCAANNQVINQPLARFAVIEVSGSNASSDSMGGSFVISKTGKTSGTFGYNVTTHDGLSVSATWNAASTISVTEVSTSCTATAYYYR